MQISDKDYYALEALSQSGAKSLLVSPAQFRAERDTPKSDTPDMAFGRLVHALVLEPATVAERFGTGPDLSSVRTKDGKPASNPAATTEGKALAAEWYASHPDVTVVAPADFAKAEAVAASLLDTPHPVEALTLRQMLALPESQTELAILWQSAGVPCKAKLDAVVRLPDGRVLIADPKTTAKPMTVKGLTTAIADFGYHVQKSAYLEALASIGVCDAEFVFIFVSKTAPYEAAWISLDDAATDAGASRFDAAKQIYAACVRSGNWPSAQVSGLLPFTLGLPTWYRENLSDD